MSRRIIFKRYQYIVLVIFIIFVGISSFVYYIDSKASTVANPLSHYVTGKVMIIDSNGKIIGPASTQQIIIGYIGASIGDDGTYALTTRESGCLNVNFIGKTTRILNQYQIANTFEQQICFDQDNANPVINLSIVTVQ